MRTYKAIFFSDTHILNENSRLRDGFKKETIEALAEYDITVSGGDKFDLTYAFHHSVDEFKEEKHKRPPIIEKDTEEEAKLHPKLKGSLRSAVKHAVDINGEFCEKIYKRNPKCRIIDVLGNHDNITRFTSELDELQKKQENFHWEREFIKIGRGIVTHGDTVLDCNGIKHRETIKPRTWVRTYLALGAERMLSGVLPRLWEYWHGGKNVIPIFAKKLKKQENIFPHLDDVNNVFLAHIHVKPFINRKHEDVLFHQTGASMPKCDCVPVEITIEAPKKSEFYGKDKNIILPGAEIVDVREVYIPGLSHRGR